ncbi:MAG: NAD(+)/NADH kinase [Desulfobacterales bacterium]|nr:NAD(+)/NADH kinase [Desulfobacterales bacterium]
MEPPITFRNIGIVVKPDAEARAKADELEKWLGGRQIQAFRIRSPMPSQGRSSLPGPVPPQELDAVFVLGGDGTFLSAARWIGDRNIPLLGIKFGQVGYLAAVAAENLFSAAEAVLQNALVTETRMRLCVEMFRNGDAVLRETVLNDVVVNKGALARLAHIQTDIDGRYLTTYSADGLIIATPTGSTAYSLAAGGPVIHPAVPGIILTPICPFTLTNRPLIVPDQAEITLRLGEKSSDIMLTMDGQEGFEVRRNDVIRVRKHTHPLQMLTLPGQRYYDVLKAKLRWSGGRV